MKKYLLISVMTVYCLACSNENPKMKTKTISEYSTKTELGQLVKGEIVSKYSIGFHPNGTQEFFVGLIGYSSNNDTTKFAKGIPIKTKKIDNKTFNYDDKDALKWVSVTKSDTIFLYEGDDLENTRRYSIRDRNKRLISECDLVMNEKKTYTQAKYNKYNDCTYAIIQVEYEPSDYDKKYHNELELARERAEKKETTIFEAEYVYY